MSGRGVDSSTRDLFGHRRGYYSLISRKTCVESCRLLHSYGLPMSSGVPASSSPTRAGASPTRGRQHVSRSITDRLPGTSSKHHHHSHASHSHHHITGHISASLHRRDRSRDERHGHGSTAAQSAAALLHHVAPRSSLEVPRTEGTASVVPSPQQSRRGSVLIPANAESLGLARMPLSAEELLRRERVKTEARTAYVYNSQTIPR